MQNKELEKEIDEFVIHNDSDRFSFKLIKKLEARIETLEEEARWILVEEGLPEEAGTFAVLLLNYHRWHEGGMMIRKKNFQLFHVTGN